ncbi:MAG: hypothetical protein EZS28_041294, partial [Streblomastix strix]
DNRGIVGISQPECNRTKSGKINQQNIVLGCNGSCLNSPEGADVSWKENTYPNNLANTDRYKEVVMNYIENQKFKEEFRIQVQHGTVKQVPKYMITHFNPTYIIPTMGGNWRKILNMQQIEPINSNRTFQNGLFDFNDVTNEEGRICDNVRRRKSESPYTDIQGTTTIPQFQVSWKEQEKLEQDTKDVTQFMRSLGWSMQLAKCCEIPKRTFVFLGWKCKSMNLEVEIPTKRSKQLKEKIRQWKTKIDMNQLVKSRQVASIFGELNFLETSIVDASLRLQSINRLKTDAIKRQGWNGKIRLTKRILGDLTWWMNQLKLNHPREFERRELVRRMTTDAADCTDGNEEAKSIHLKEQLPDYTNGQHGYRTCVKEMKDKGTEQEGGCIKSPNKERRQYSEKVESLRSTSGTSVQCMTRRLRELNEQMSQ